MLKEWINKLSLEAHPAGGYFKETSKSSINTSSATGLTVPLFTNILFLLEEGGTLSFHQLQSDEVFVFHDGSPFTVHCFHPDGKYEKKDLGRDSEHGQLLQFMVPKGLIFASSVEKGWSLVGCMVSPGFDFREFRQYSLSELCTQFPQHENMLNAFTS